MRSATHPEGIEARDGAGTGALTINGENNRRTPVIGYILWFLGLIFLVASCFVIESHKTPYPADLAAAHFIQGLHLATAITLLLLFPSLINDPIPSIIALTLWVCGLLIIGFIQHRRGKSAKPWVMAGLFLGLAVMFEAGINTLLNEVIGRPRPLPKDGIHVDGPLVPFPTYPSGHTAHDIVYYGFLLYLSFSARVRRWRYHWVLIPFQIYAVFDILAIGYSRILRGDHWFTDVLGGYLEGLVLLGFFIFLYHWTDRALQRRRIRKELGKGSTR